MTVDRKQLITATVLLGILIGGGSIILSTRNQPVPKPEPQQGTEWSQEFGDEFDGDSLDTSKWVTCYDWYYKDYNGCSNNGNKELEWYMPSQVSVKNGAVTFLAEKNPVKGWNGKYEQEYPYRSGMISTGRPDWESQPRSTYTYGYFEARMKTNSGRGVWPAFWLLPADKIWPPEIDVMEILGHRPTEVLQTNHWGTADAPQKDVSIISALKNPNDWHTYAVNWQKGRIDWYIDGKKTKTVISEHVPDKPMIVIANLAIGGLLPGNPDASTVFPASTQVDYIRIYKESPR